ncbi:hypothetical protein [Enterococcus rivorum]|uniref:Uncharacterized protein n=1 Tax=Enterococcus rivorum TaxID=762845 RepID=A0A1E5L0B7_9ENTE|nr:hypothetical protein [Enterococcus rivorum]MBP2098823.1 hypothetical protein [Enterococcus rivorum]OEH83556.1 hypothetical protein BCR26_08735 [Enterococcus rivorum]
MNSITFKVYGWQRQIHLSNIVEAEIRADLLKEVSYLYVTKLVSLGDEIEAMSFSVQVGSEQDVAIYYQGKDLEEDREFLETCFQCGKVNVDWSVHGVTCEDCIERHIDEYITQSNTN